MINFNFFWYKIKITFNHLNLLHFLIYFKTW